MWLPVEQGESFTSPLSSSLSVVLESVFLCVRVSLKKSIIFQWTKAALQYLPCWILHVCLKRERWRCLAAGRSRRFHLSVSKSIFTSRWTPMFSFLFYPNSPSSLFLDNQDLWCISRFSSSSSIQSCLSRVNSDEVNLAALISGLTSSWIIPSTSAAIQWDWWRHFLSASGSAFQSTVSFYAVQISKLKVLLRTWKTAEQWCLGLCGSETKQDSLCPQTFIFFGLLSRLDVWGLQKSTDVVLQQGSCWFCPSVLVLVK